MIDPLVDFGILQTEYEPHKTLGAEFRELSTFRITSFGKGLLEAIHGAMKPDTAMSEYQYHEWQAVDRVLTPEEQAAVNDLSSHIEVSSSRAVVTYHWSDFRHDPKQVLLKYFDAYFYLANWGSLRLMFRFPKGLLDEADIVHYCIDEYITLFKYYQRNPIYQAFLGKSRPMSTDTPDFRTGSKCSAL